MSNSMVVRIGADDAQLQAALKRSQQGLRQLGSQVRAGAAMAAKFGAALGAVGAATVAALVKTGLSAVDAQAKLARQLNTTSESMSTVERASKLTGVAMGTIETSAKHLNHQLALASQGGGTAVGALDRLGLSAQQLAAIPLDQRISAINQAIRENIPAQERAAVAADLFGKRNEAAMRSMDPEAFAQASREAEAFGLAVSDVDAATIERANDALSTIGEVVKGIANRLAVALAPVIEYVAQQFRKVAMETNGFKNVVQRAMDIAVKGAGYVANWVGVVIKTFQSLREVVAKVADFLADAMSRALDSVRNAVNALIRGINRVADAIPGLTGSLKEFEPGVIERATARAMEGAVSVVEWGADALREKLGGELPSDNFQRWLDEVREASRKASEEAIAARSAMGFQVEDGEGGGDDKEAERHRKQIEDRIERIRQGLLTESELRQEQFALNLEALQEAHELELLSEEEYRERLQGLAEQHADRMRQIQEREAEEARRIEQARNDAIFNQRVGFMRNIGKAMSALNRGAFEENKTAARAEAGVSGALGVMEAWRSGMQTNGPHAPFVAAGYAGAAAVNAARMISGIGKQTYGGGSAPSAPDASAPQPAVQAASAPQQSVSISLQGDTFSKATVLSFIEQINDAIADGARLQVT